MKESAWAAFTLSQFLGWDALSSLSRPPATYPSAADGIPIGRREGGSEIHSPIGRYRGGKQETEKGGLAHLYRTNAENYQTVSWKKNAPA